MEFDLVQGDTTAVDADAIVSAANTDIQMGGGVAGQIRNAAGEATREEVNTKDTLEIGGVTVPSQRSSSSTLR